MHVFLMRHADAVAPERWRKGDSSRPLSDQGRARLDQALPRLKDAGLSVQKIFTSPFVRAQETADRVAAALDQPAEPVAAISAGCTFRAYRDLVAQQKDVSSVLIVGHMPEISVAAAHFSGVPSFIEEGFGPGEMVSIETHEAGRGALLWRRRLEDW